MRCAASLFLCLRLAAAATPIVERDAPATLIAIGDAHGDFDRLLQVLIAAHVIEVKPATPASVSWTAGRATLVMTGDMIDKGPQPVNVIRLLSALRADAPKHGGEVILLSGNHEAEFLAGPNEKKAADFIADLKQSGISVKDTVACKGEIGEFLCGLPYGARVGEWFFSHAGNTGGASIPELTAGIANGTYKVTGPDSLLEARIWFSEPVLKRNAAALGVRHVVEGHQPGTMKFEDGVERKAGEMFQRWGLLFFIDTGMSRGVDDSKGAALRIADGKATAICPDGTETLLWSEAGHQDIGRATPCKAH